jgi:hypothetical protein
MPAQNMGASSFLSQPGSNSSNSVPTHQSLRRYPVRQLRAPHQPGGLSRPGARQRPPQARSTARGNELRLMTLTFTGTNELQKMVAEHQVVITQTRTSNSRETGGVHRHQRLLDLTGNPPGGPALREGKGDRCGSTWRARKCWCAATPHELPAAELGQSAFTALGTKPAGRIEGNDE